MKLFKSVDEEMKSVEGVIKDTPINRYFMWSGKKIMDHPVIGGLCAFIILPSIIGVVIGLLIRKGIKGSGNL